MSDVPEQTYSPCATCDTMLLEHKETFGRSSITRRRSSHVRHVSDVKADQLDKDLTEYEVRPVRLVNLCTDKKSYRFGLLKVELLKCKTRSAMGLSKQDTWKTRDFSTLGGSAVAEFVTGAFLGPCEKLDDETDVVNGLFFVFGLTFRLTPCNMVKISVQQRMAGTICLVTTPSEMSIDVIQMLSLGHDIATVVVSLTDCPDSEFILESYLTDPKRMRSNTKITADHEKTVFFVCHSSCCLPSLSQDPDHLPKQVAGKNDSSAHWEIYVRRLHHRVREGE